MRRTIVAAVLLCACGGGGEPPVTNPPPPPPPPPPPATQGTVQGSVTDESNAGIASVGVTLSRPGATARQTNTGANGSYAFTAVDAGAWSITAAAPPGWEGVGALTASVQVTANQTATVPAIRLRQVQAPPPGAAISVDIIDNAFVPSPATVLRGGRVTWTNGGTQIHNVVFGTQSSPNLAPGARYEQVFPNAGAFDYQCTFHPGMNGRIVVQ